MILQQSQQQQSTLLCPLMHSRRNRNLHPSPALSPVPEQSTTDMFSRVQSIFLQRFFRWNLADHFQTTFLSLEQLLSDRLPTAKHIKELSSQIFAIKSHINIAEFAQKMDLFYRINTKELSHSFKLLYSNAVNDNEQVLKQGEMVAVKVRMRIPVEKIQEMTSEFYKDIEACNEELASLPPNEKKHFLSQVESHSQKHVNLFVIYFGDCNFHLFDKRKYSPRTMNFFGRSLPIKIFVFFVSRIGMVEKFRRINKLGRLQCINDLLIQLYEFKRQKMKAKRLRLNSQTMKNKNKWKIIMSIIKWLAIVSISGLVLAIIILIHIF